MKPLTIFAAVISNAAVAVLMTASWYQLQSATVKVMETPVIVPQPVVIEKVVNVPFTTIVEQPLPMLVNDDVMCLSQNIYHEARGESREGQIQVAFTTLNRVGKRNWPDSVCGVVYQRKQFSWTLERPYMNLRGLQERNDYRQAIEIATGVLNGTISNNLGADHYFAPNKVKPVWAKNLTLIADVGNHRFMR